jgi:hypothetical protein
MGSTPRTGVVRDRQGKPVQGALIAVEWGTAPTPEVALRTGQDGRFRLALPSGLFRIAAYAPSGASGRREIEIDGGEEDIVIELTEAEGGGDPS